MSTLERKKKKTQKPTPKKLRAGWFPKLSLVQKTKIMLIWFLWLLYSALKIPGRDLGNHLFKLLATASFV